MYRYISQKEAEELRRANDFKKAVIFILIGVIVGIGIATTIREKQLDNMEWYEARIQCLEQAPKYYNAWCDDNNQLIK